MILHLIAIGYYMLNSINEVFPMGFAIVTSLDEDVYITVITREPVSHYDISVLAWKTPPAVISEETPWCGTQIWYPAYPRRFVSKKYIQILPISKMREALKYEEIVVREHVKNCSLQVFDLRSTVHREQ